MRALLVLALASLALAGAAAATPGAAPLLRYGGAGQGVVVFDGRLHAANGLRCNDCHLDLFTTRKRALISMEDHEAGTSCFACHREGARAFAACDGCHRR